MLEIQGAELGIVEGIQFVGDPVRRLRRRHRMQQDPDIALPPHGAFARAQPPQPIEVPGNLCRDEKPVAPVQFGEPGPGARDTDQTVGEPSMAAIMRACTRAMC